MREELLAGVRYLKSLISNSQQLDLHKVETFEEKLAEVLCKRYTGHWYPETPMKGQAYRCIRINRQQEDESLLEACAQSGLKYSDLPLPKEMTMWIDPYEVCCRMGENNPYYTVASFDSKKRRNLEENPAQVDSSYSSTTITVSSHESHVTSSDSRFPSSSKTISCSSALDLPRTSSDSGWASSSISSSDERSTHSPSDSTSSSFMGDDFDSGMETLVLRMPESSYAVATQTPTSSPSLDEFHDICWSPTQECLTQTVTPTFITPSPLWIPAWRVPEFYSNISWNPQQSTWRQERLAFNEEGQGHRSGN
ncbi:uncharacterized protein LOC142498172 [Ascaphus truei]|uniref:uncharacterized protein LOC142498172 n=1 Tax=Ascaphus truei TaxID=8439 RepID=UPI003F591BB5